MSHLSATAYAHGDPGGRVRLTGRRESPDDVLLRNLGPAYTRYRERWRAAESFETRPDFPLHLDVDANVTCNLRCVMCPLGAGQPLARYDRKFLDFRLFDRAVREGAERGLAALRLGITGEPLLRPGILDFVHLAERVGILDRMLITNGLLLGEKTAAGLIQAGLTRLMVSIDAVTPETYDRVRPGGDLATVVENVERFLRIRDRMGLELPLLRVSFVHMSLNAEEKEAFEARWLGLADYVSIQTYANILEREETAFHAPGENRRMGFRCAEPRTRMSLFVNGDLFPCCSDFGRAAPVANANRVSLAEAWRSEACLRLADLHAQGRWAESPVCRRCVGGLDRGPSQGEGPES